MNRDDLKGISLFEGEEKHLIIPGEVLFLLKPYK